MNPLLQCKRTILPLFIAGVLACFGLLTKALAIVPAPDGGYPGGNTAEGQNALLSLNVNTGTNNTAVGWFSLRSNVEGQFNTAVGAGTLFNSTAHRNTAIGGAAMFSNTVGSFNTAVGMLSLFTNSTGTRNTAIGDGALFSNTSANFNTAVGNGALRNNTTGASNVAIGEQAGFFATSGSHNVYIGENMTGNPGESNACYIASIFGQTSAIGMPVLINSVNKLGTTTSSRRFKEEIKPMERASEALLALKPVTFRYKKEIDPVGASQFGLVAEEVEKVNSDLVVRDKEGKPYTVRYDAVNAMLLNEFLKEHRAVQELKSTVAKQEAIITKQQKGFESKIAAQQKQIERLTAGLQKVSAQLEASKPAPQTVQNNE